jgi:hypothetical protein
MREKTGSKLDQNRRQLDFRAWSSPAPNPAIGCAAGSKSANRILRFRPLFLGVLAAFLVWEVITRSLVAYLADTHPKAAIRLRSTDSVALLNLAQGKLNAAQARNVDNPASNRDKTSPPTARPNAENTLDIRKIDPINPLPDVSPEEFAQIRAEAELALLSDPLNARAFRILGQLSQRDSDEERTKTLMQAAARRSLLEIGPVFWMMRKSYEQHDYRAAMDYANTLLRTYPVVPQLGVVTLAELVENPASNGEVEQLLLSNPPWRSKFFEYLPTSVSDARSPLHILLSLKDTQVPPTADDLRFYLKFLIGNGFDELAYYAWLQFLPAEQLSKAGHLFNGSFEFSPSEVPFDWVLTAASGVTIEIASRPDLDGGHALLLQFGPGRAEDFSVTEVIMLAPGSYQFTGKFKSDVVTSRGLKWRVTCARDPKTLIGESPTVSKPSSTWESFEFSLAVPDTGCPSQHVELILDSRSESERFVSGSIWYDDLQILGEASIGSTSP